jgi:DNA polymerase III subunit epsilon
MNKDNTPSAVDLAAALALVRGAPRYRVSEKLPEPFSDLPEDLPSGSQILVIVDVKTNGLDPAQDDIIELGIMWCAVTRDGDLLGHSRPLSWRQEPRKPMSAEATQATGLSDEDVAGEQIDDARIMEILANCKLIIAHDARFVLPFLTTRCPQIKGKSWACTMTELLWKESGIACRSLPHVLNEHSRFVHGDSAANNVWSIFQLLKMTPSHIMNGQNSSSEKYLDTLLASSLAGAIRVESRAGFDKKEWLKARGYMWNPNKKRWWRDLNIVDYLHEEKVFADAGLPILHTIHLSAADRYRV